MHELRPRSGANPIRKFILFDRGGQSRTPQPPQFFLSAPSEQWLTPGAQFILRFRHLCRESGIKSRAASSARHYPLPSALLYSSPSPLAAFLIATIRRNRERAEV